MSTPRNVLYREGRYYARVVVPAELRAIVGKTELREPLGPDKRIAFQRCHAVLAGFHEQLEDARRRLPRAFFDRELARDDAERVGPGYAFVRDLNATSRPIYAAHLRRVVSGRAPDDEAEATIGWAVDEATGPGRLADGTPERRAMLQTLAAVQLQALAQFEARDRGAIAAPAPMLAEALPVPLATAATPASQTVNGEGAQTLAELLPAFHAERKVAPKTAEEHRVAVRMFGEFLGEPRAVASITKREVRAYKDALLKLPSRYTLRFPGKTLPQAIEANAKRAEPYAPLQAKTINEKWLAHLRAILAWCAGNDLVTENSAAGIKVQTGKGYKEPSRLPFTPDDLARLFSPPLFSPSAQWGTEQWALLVALYTGARSSSEIARLALADIYAEQGVLTFSLAAASKNVRSKRLVPVHRHLIQLGLPAYADALRRKGEARLFPDWEPEDKINRWFLRQYRAEVGVTDPRKVFHSFRHTMKTALAGAGVARDISDAITGHADQSVAGQYLHDRHTTMIHAMQDGLNRVRFEPVENLTVL